MNNYFFKLLLKNLTLSDAKLYAKRAEIQIDDKELMIIVNYLRENYDKIDTKKEQMLNEIENLTSAMTRLKLEQLLKKINLD